MPIKTSIPITRISQADFGEIAYEVMHRVFEIHNEFGRFFDEKIYKRVLALRLPAVTLEVPVDVVFETFHKQYLLDTLVLDGGIFEFKAADKITPRHRAQLLNYLLLCDVAHGKLVNIRPSTIEHEFVNTQWRFTDRLMFKIARERWNASFPNAKIVHDFLTAFLNEIGTGLETKLYEEAVIHALGNNVQKEVSVCEIVGGQSIGQQKLHMLCDEVAITVTGLDKSLADFETHTLRLLNHIDLRAIAWINVNLKQVTFTTMTK